MCISKQMESYDYIIAGGGCAGLSLAYYLSQSAAPGASVLIIDREQKSNNDRTWCFWTEEPIAYDRIVARKWQKLAFKSHKASRSDELAQQYQLIRSADFYELTQSAIRRKSNFQFLYGDIARTGEDEHGAFAVVDNEKYYATWLFDSCFTWQQLQQSETYQHFLIQHFKGWFIETDHPTFTPDCATLMDFRTPQHGDARFLYVLPLSATKALVEYTIFSDRLLSDAEYDETLRDYIRETMGIHSYRILEKERGAIPMTDLQLQWDSASRIVPIGTLGGAVKPTTGYAFLRIQQQAQRIVQALAKTGRPEIGKRKQRFRFYDKLLLSILQHEGGSAASIFRHLFMHNDMSRILTFLDERTNIWQEAKIFARLPLLPFLRAIKRVYWSRLKTVQKSLFQLATTKKIV